MILHWKSVRARALNGAAFTPSYWGSNHCMYGIYKKGAAWEAHMGQRLVRGKKVPVEKYLDFRKLFHHPDFWFRGSASCEQ